MDKDAIAKKLFNKSYDELSEKEREKVDNIYIHEISCQLAVEEGLKRMFHYCGGKDIAVKYLGTLLGFKPEDVEKILKECDKIEVNEEVCKDVNKLRKAILCLAYKKATSVDDIGRVFSEVWDDLRKTCESFGVKID